VFRLCLNQVLPAVERAEWSLSRQVRKQGSSSSLGQPNTGFETHKHGLTWPPWDHVLSPGRHKVGDKVLYQDVQPCKEKSRGQTFIGFLNIFLFHKSKMHYHLIVRFMLNGVTSTFFG